MADLTQTHITDQLRALGVAAGGVLLVHTSFRAVGPIEGGPRGLIAALLSALGPHGTLVMASWTGDDDIPFDPSHTPSSPSLGIVPQTFWRLAGVARSSHPFAVAAFGARAEDVTSGSLPIPPHAAKGPIGRVHDLDGTVLLLGVDHTANTTLHLAELVAGAPYRVPKHCTVLEHGRSRRIDYGENDHCCQLFALADDWLRVRNLQREGVVGHAHARLARARDIVSVVCEHLADNPITFLHPFGQGCDDCDEAHRSIVPNFIR